jgi:hypothetical protein
MALGSEQRGSSGLPLPKNKTKKRLRQMEDFSGEKEQIPPREENTMNCGRGSGRELDSIDGPGREEG